MSANGVIRSYQNSFYISKTEVVLEVVSWEVEYGIPEIPLYQKRKSFSNCWTSVVFLLLFNLHYAVQIIPPSFYLTRTGTDCYGLLVLNLLLVTGHELPPLVCKFVIVSWYVNLICEKDPPVTRIGRKKDPICHPGLIPELCVGEWVNKVLRE